MIDVLRLRDIEKEAIHHTLSLAREVENTLFFSERNTIQRIIEYGCNALTLKLSHHGKAKNPLTPQVTVESIEDVKTKKTKKGFVAVPTKKKDKLQTKTSASRARISKV